MTRDGTPTYDDVLAAARRIEGKAVRTPLLSLPILDQRLGARVFLKPENLQHTGSFKFRGALNAVTLASEAGARAIVACSSGNHAQGVAAAARLLGLPATIVMPADAPRVKRERTRAHGARLILYDREKDDRDAVAARIVEETGGELVHPYDDGRVIAGQGTVGLEIGEDLERLGQAPDVALVCCGGGGLIAGTALALKQVSPDVEVRSVEPQGFDDYARSLQAGECLANDRASGSICDALMAPRPGRIGFAMNSERLADGLAVTDDEALAAVAFLFEEARIVAEPGGAVAVAALLSGRIDVRGRTAIAVVSGGNIDPTMLARASA